MSQSSFHKIAASATVFVFALILLSSSTYLPSAAALAPTKTATLETAGYYIVDSQEGSINETSAKFNVPSIYLCQGGGTTEIYIGIDPYFLGIMTGFDLRLNCLGGQQYEVYTIIDADWTQVTVPAIAAGDKLAVSVSVNSSNMAHLVMQDTSTTHSSWKIDTFGTTSGPKDEAIWYMYATYWNQPLPNFSRIKFTDVKATINGFSGSFGSFIANPTVSLYRDVLVNSTSRPSHVRVQCSSVSSASEGFSITFKSAS